MGGYGVHAKAHPSNLELLVETEVPPIESDEQSIETEGSVTCIQGFTEDKPVESDQPVQPVETTDQHLESTAVTHFRESDSLSTHSANVNRPLTKLKKRQTKKNPKKKKNGKLRKKVKKVMKMKLKKKRKLVRSGKRRQ